MRRYAGLVLILALPLLVSLYWLGGKSVSSGKSDLSVEFVSFTNNPVHAMKPVRVEVTSDAAGRCVLFRVKNNSLDSFIGFETTYVETNGGHGWERFNLPGSWTGVGGGKWSPGYSCYYAVAWPPGLDTNAVWRMQLSVAREPTGWRQSINLKIHRNIFGDYARQTTASSEVR